MDARKLAALREIDDEAWPVLEQLARALHVKNAGLQPTLDAIVKDAVRTVDVAEFAGITMLLKGELVPQATLGQPPHELDLLQRRLGRGPCFDAAREQAPITIEDTASEARWPEVAEQAARLGVAAMLCVPLWAGENRLGTLSLYGPKPESFTEHHLRLTSLYATHGALALADAARSDQLQRALASRDVIGQAKGVLMERHRITAQAAFDLLVQASQATNRRLAQVAEYFAETGELPTR